MITMFEHSLLFTASWSNTLDPRSPYSSLCPSAILLSIRKLGPVHQSTISNRVTSFPLRGTMSIKDCSLVPMNLPCLFLLTWQPTLVFFPVLSCIPNKIILKGIKIFLQDFFFSNSYSVAPNFFCLYCIADVQLLSKKVHTNAAYL